MELFVRQTAIARFEQSHLCAQRTQYLASLLARGTSQSRVRCLSSTLVRVVELLALQELRMVSETEITSAGDRWAANADLHASAGPGRNSKQVFVSAARQFLRFHACLLATARPALQFEAEWLAYLDAKSEQLAPSTLAVYRLRIRCFILWLTKQETALATCTVRNVEFYLASRRETCNARTLTVDVCALRSFFLYGAQRGWCSRYLSRGLQAPNVPRSNVKAVPIPWDTVRRLVDAQTGSHHAEPRARAMMLLCSAYGLRSIEVCRLRLDQFNWHDNVLRLNRAKNGRVQLFPVTPELRQAVHAYLVQTRPVCACPLLFVTLSPPYRAVKPGVLSTLVAKRARAFGLTGPRISSHALRHAATSMLLNTGRHCPA